MKTKSRVNPEKTKVFRNCLSVPRIIVDIRILLILTKEVNSMLHSHLNFTIVLL